MSILDQWLIKNYNEGKGKLKRNMTCITVSVIISDSSYSYNIVDNNSIYSKFIKYKIQ